MHQFKQWPDSSKQQQKANLKTIKYIFSVSIKSLVVVLGLFFAANSVPKVSAINVSNVNDLKRMVCELLVNTKYYRQVKKDCLNGLEIIGDSQLCVQV